MMGVARRPPSAPSDVMVNVEPWRSCALLMPALASLPRRSISRARSRRLSLVGVLDDRDHEARVGRGSDADVVGLAVDELLRLLVERAVQDGVLLERRDDGLHDEGQERELRAVLLGGWLEARAQAHQRGRVALFDEREVRGRLRRLLHLQRDAPSHPDERHALVRCAGRDGDGPVRGHLRGRGARPRASRVGEHVGLRHATLRPDGFTFFKSMPRSRAALRVAGVARGLSLK